MLYKTCSFNGVDQTQGIRSGITKAVDFAKEIICLLKKNCESFYNKHMVLFAKIESDRIFESLNETNGIYTIPQDKKHYTRHDTFNTLQVVTDDLKEFDNVISEFLKENQPSYSLNCCSKPSLISQVNLTQMKSLLVVCQNAYKDSTDFSQV